MAVQTGLAVTPSPLGGHGGLVDKLQADTHADFADLAVKAKERGCTIFGSLSSD